MPVGNRGKTWGRSRDPPVRDPGGVKRDAPPLSRSLGRAIAVVSRAVVSLGYEGHSTSAPSEADGRERAFACETARRTEVITSHEGADHDFRMLRPATLEKPDSALKNLWFRWLSGEESSKTREYRRYLPHVVSQPREVFDFTMVRSRDADLLERVARGRRRRSGREERVSHWPVETIRPSGVMPPTSSRFPSPTR